MSLIEHPEIIESFEKLGLSPNEARVYLALIENYPITGYQLSKISGILRPVVYEMLGRLVEKGGAKIVKSNPDSYAPVEISAFLKNIESDFTDAKKNISQSLQDNLVHDQTDFFWNLIGKKNILNAVESMINETMSELYIRINSQELLNEILPSLLKKSEENVHIDIFSHYSLDTQGITLYSYGLDPRTPLDYLSPSFLSLVSDDNHALMSNIDDNKSAKSVQSKNNILINTIKQGILKEIYIIRLWKLLGTDKIKIMMTNEDRKMLETVERLTRATY